MKSIMLIFASLALTGCEQLTGTKPASAECHGYAPEYDTVSVNPLKVDTVTRAHVCGMPRVAP